MGRPGTVPKKTGTTSRGRPGSTSPAKNPAGKSRGRPGSVARPYMLNETQIENLINTTPEVPISNLLNTTVDDQLVKKATEFENLVDAAYPIESTKTDSHYPPHAKVDNPLESATNPLEASVDRDISAIGEVTLLMLDAGLDLYYKALEYQSTCKNGSPEYWDAQKEISKRNASMINLGQHWRAQQDRINRDCMVRLTNALLHRK